MKGKTVRVIKTREQIHAEAIQKASRAYDIAANYDKLSTQDAMEKAISVYREALWQPIKYAPRIPASEFDPDTLLLLRSTVFPCV